MEKVPQRSDPTHFKDHGDLTFKVILSLKTGKPTVEKGSRSLLTLSSTSLSERQVYLSR